jgi:hypothetical protein
MVGLRETQRAFFAAIGTNDASGLTPLILGDALDPEVRVAVYRRHRIASLGAVLGSTFAATAAAAGGEVFGIAANLFIQEHPPRRPSLAEYGGEFPAFLRSLPVCAPIPWLADLARLEWAIQRAYHAPQARALERDDLLALIGAEGAAAVLTLDPSTALVSTGWAVHEAWSAWRQDGGWTGGEPARRETRLLVRREAADVSVETVPLGEGEFIRALLDRRPLDHALAAAAGIDESFDVGRLVGRLVERRLFAASPGLPDGRKGIPE